MLIARARSAISAAIQCHHLNSAETATSRTHFAIVFGVAVVDVVVVVVAVVKAITRLMRIRFVEVVASVGACAYVWPHMYDSHTYSLAYGGAWTPNE